MELHRNSPKRFYGPDKIYFIVTKTYQNFPYFQKSIFCDLLIEELKLCKKIKQFELYAFSVIYDHLNLLVKPSEEYDISKVMQSIKKEFSRDINYVISSHARAGDIPECRLHGHQYSRKLKKTIEVPNLSNYQDRYLKKYRGVKKNQAGAIPEWRPPRFKWQKSFYDHVIRNDEDFHNHYAYTKYNHVKHGLPEDWPYTSEHYEEIIDEILL